MVSTVREQYRKLGILGDSNWPMKGHFPRLQLISKLLREKYPDCWASQQYFKWLAGADLFGEPSPGPVRMATRFIYGHLLPNLAGFGPEEREQFFAFAMLINMHRDWVVQDGWHPDDPPTPDEARLIVAGLAVVFRGTPCATI